MEMLVQYMLSLSCCFIVVFVHDVTQTVATPNLTEVLAESYYLVAVQDMVYYTEIASFDLCIYPCRCCHTIDRLILTNHFFVKIQTLACLLVEEVFGFRRIEEGHYSIKTRNHNNIDARIICLS